MSREAEPWIVGVDAGGTKTVAWVGKLTHNAHGEHQIRWCGCGSSGPGNPSSIGLTGALHAIQAAIAAAFAECVMSHDDGASDNSTLQSIWVGAAGAGRPEVASELRRELELRFASAEVNVTTDVALLIAIAQSAAIVEAPEWIRQQWSSSIVNRTFSTVDQADSRIVARAKSNKFVDRAQPAIAIISGTGSVVWSNNGHGNENRWGGFGPQSGDLGSGCWFGQQATQAILDELDNRGPATALRPALLNHLGISDEVEFRRVLVERFSTQAELGSLAPLVLATAYHDLVADKIVRAGVDGLVAMSCDAIRWLGRTDSINVVLGGGLLVGNTGLLQRVWHGISEFVEQPSAKADPSRVVSETSVALPKLSTYLSHQPVWGALVSAADKLVCKSSNGYS